MSNSFLDIDTKRTVENKKALKKNVNLLYWYMKLYEQMFKDIIDFDRKKILEVGSGTSPLTIFHPHVMTSDILDIDYVDYKIDCMQINKFSKIKDFNLDIITCTNVLHHLKNPVEFLLKASKKLKLGGLIIFTEPYFSFLSKLVYTNFHREKSDFLVENPELNNVIGPLSSANMAIPFLIFFSNKIWKEEVKKIYSIKKNQIKYFSSVSYFLTGGISHRFPVPHMFYKLFFFLDAFFVKIAPKFFSSFFILVLKKMHNF